MLRFLKTVKEITGKTLKHLSLGGGLGVKYTDSDNPMPLDEAIKMVSEAVTDECSKLGLELPELSVEPGRSIVGEAGTTLYTVGSVKEIAGIRNYIAIDGGMTDNPRYALYGSKYTVLIANRANEKKDYVATVAGRCCESGDLIGKDMEIQKPVPGDILAVLTTGAYNYTMASNYNRVPRPAVVFVKDGQSRVAVRRETYEDLYHLDV
jgi:diaminopimelate decarboxylase